MIRDQWYVILESREVRAGKPLGVRRLGENLVLWRDEKGAIQCVADKCAHRGASLSHGKVAAGCIQCPFHGIRFDGGGKGRLIPANGAGTPVPLNFVLPSYPIREADGFVWMFWGEGDSGEDPRLFDDLGADFSYSSWMDHWACHYTRCIENQLDVVHLPFVHHNTIGRGNAVLVHGPRIEWKGRDLFVYVYNEVDGGQRPERPEETPLPRPGQFHLQFRMPHTWQNWINGNLRIFIAFVPVDEGNTILYLRFYQRFVRLPGLGRLVSYLGKLQSIVIARQDKRVVLTQVPGKSELKMGENLIQGDLPILEYRKMRELMKGGDGIGGPLPRR
jgi:phenylpropionate dioxygenase-like ring-hydroxylating dioxygenase large terminal subunit